MSQIDRSQIEWALAQKGFIRKDGSHRYFHHQYNGKITGIKTYTSHGSQYKTYGDDLLKAMKKELRLDTLQEVRNLLLCPMDTDAYNQKLKSKGLIPSF